MVVCGASAALAITALLPKDEQSENNLIFTVLSVTLLSTVAMIVYPILVARLNLSVIDAGVILGGKIIDVAQVVGAGFSLSDEIGEIATLVKLLRVSMLAPIVLVISIYWRQNRSGTRILPQFVFWFFVFATVKSVGWMPPEISNLFASLARCLLVIAIAAFDIKISIAQVMVVVWRAIALVTLETLFIGSLVLVGLRLIEWH